MIKEVNADRKAHGKKPFDDDGEPPGPTKKRRYNHLQEEPFPAKKAEKEKNQIVTKSVTGPDSGLFEKGNISGSLPMKPTRPVQAWVCIGNGTDLRQCP